MSKTVLKPKSVKAQAESQLAMAIPKKPSEVVFGVKRSINKGIINASVVAYWRSFWFVSAFMTTAATIILLLLLLFFNNNALPETVPLIYFQSNSSWATVPKLWLWGIPTLTAIFWIAITKLQSRIYRSDRRLVLMLNIAIIFTDITLLIGLAQLFSILLIY